MFKTWDQIKQLVDDRKLKIRYKQTSDKYIIYIFENGQEYWTEIWINTDAVEGLDINKNNTDKTDFETNYKDKEYIEPVTDDGKTVVRSESRPLGFTTCFTSRGDNNDIGDGTELIWDFANGDNEVTAPTGYKRKRMEVSFVDPIHIKEGTAYFFQKLKKSYIDLYVVCPTGSYYLDNSKTPQLATEDTPISHYVINYFVCGDCPMGDELNTESCSDEIPAGYKIRLEVTVPDTDLLSYGHISLEIYRKRTVVL